MRGFVADSLSGEILPYANVYIKEINRGTTTDHRGYFIMTSLPDNQLLSLEISNVGYRTKRLMIRLDKSQVKDLRVELAVKSYEIGTVEKIAERVNKENATDLSLQKVTIRDMEYLPKGVELDVFRSLQNLPGVQTTGDVSSRFYVRGSSSNENLVLLDNMPIYNPFHALGIISAIDPDIVRSVEFFKSGFPAEYNGVLSSVLKIITREGNKNKIGASGSVSLLTAKALLEGPIPNGSFVISGRKNYSNQILKKFRNNNSLPADFYDVFFKVNYANDEFMKDAKFTMDYFSSGDNILYNDPTREDFKWSNKVFSINYFQLSDSPLFYQIEVGLSNFKGERIPNLSGTKSLINEINELDMRMDFSYVYDSKDELDGGFKISEIHSKLLVENFRQQSTDIGSYGTNISAFVKYKFLRFSDFGADLGIRINATRLAGGGPTKFLEPRVSLSERITPNFVLKAAWGMYFQDLVTISDENEAVTIFEPWLITPLYLNPSGSTHYIAGCQYDPLPNLSFNLEGYYKLMKDLAVVNDKKFFVTDPNLIPGKGKAYGLEFRSKYSNGPFILNGSYALAWSFKNVYGTWYAPRYDAKHNVNLSLEVDLGKGWTAGSVWTFSSGLPFTQIAGYYDRLSIDDLTSQNYLTDSYNSFILLGERNAGRLPSYHRLDLSLSKKFQLFNYKFNFDFSVMNAYNRKNLFYFRRDTGERVDMLPFLPSASIRVEL